MSENLTLQVNFVRLSYSSLLSKGIRVYPSIIISPVIGPPLNS